MAGTWADPVSVLPDSPAYFRKTDGLLADADAVSRDLTYEVSALRKSNESPFQTLWTGLERNLDARVHDGAVSTIDLEDRDQCAIC